MGKAARFACIAAPMVCTIASLLCCLLLLIAGTNKNIGGLNGIYITRVCVSFPFPPPGREADRVSRGIRLFAGGERRWLTLALSRSTYVT